MTDEDGAAVNPGDPGPDPGDAGEARRVSLSLQSITRRGRALSAELAALWRRSLQVRVVVSTVALSSTVVLVLGMVLQTQIADRLIENKIQAALAQAENSKLVVESELGAVDPSSASLAGQLTTAVERLTNPGLSGDSASTSNAGAFEPVLVDGGSPSGVAGTGQKVGPLSDVPAVLRSAVERGVLAHKITTVQRDTTAVTMLAIGMPVSSASRTLQLYLLFPLTAEQRTLTLVQSTLVVGGLVLLVLIAGIASLVTHQVVVPVRQAAEVAERFAGGNLEERIPVIGEDDTARLAMAFNEMAASIQRQIRQLEEFGALQRRFTSDVSHELRTPLTTVRMAADVLYESRDQLDPDLHRSTELLVHELDRFELLLADLLEISRMDAGVADLVGETVDVRDTVQRAVTALQPVAERAGVPLRLFLPEEQVLAELDPRRVERIVRNLVSNALDHGEGKPVEITVGADDHAVAVLVRDYGVGLFPGQEELVFTRFWRGDPSRTRRSGGTGLGLAISLEDARLHGGWLQAWGRPGRGSAFRLTVPRRRRAELASSPLPLSPDEPAETATAPTAEADVTAADVGAADGSPDRSSDRSSDRRQDGGAPASGGPSAGGASPDGPSPDDSAPDGAVPGPGGGDRGRPEHHQPAEQPTAPGVD